MPRGVVESPSLELFKTQLSRNMSNLVYIVGYPCFEQEVDQMPSRGPLQTRFY